MTNEEKTVKYSVYAKSLKKIKALRNKVNILEKCLNNHQDYEKSKEELYEKVYKVKEELNNRCNESMKAFIGYSEGLNKVYDKFLQLGNKFNELTIKVETYRNEIQEEMKIIRLK